MKLNFLALVILGTFLVACGKKHSAPVVADIQQTELQHQLISYDENPDWGKHATPSSKEVKSTVTFNKSQIFNREFLYGADLQHSTIFDAESQLYDQVYSMGHEIAFFRKVGKSLQLVADQSWKFESDVNKPERLINEFNIVAEDNQTVTVEINKPSPVLRQMFWGSKTDITRSQWIRSLQFDPNGNYLLMESSIETLKGEIVEHMESLFPRDNLVTSNEKPLWLMESDLANRFEFLSWFSVFRNTDNGRVEDAAAFKFNLTKNKPVKWYVTANVPEDVLSDVKNAVEGWNRYFQKMWKSDGLIFAGKLPEGVKLGDPRYNVIVWDNVQNGDAAYESQAVDPLTGIQSHSNIYIPYSWLKTATEYWTDAQHADRNDKEKTNPPQKSFMGSPVRYGCVRDLSKIVLYGADKSETALKELAREVLKSVIMHEVGHALGMDHNFKGSLINSSNQFTSSIMDYNQYNLEKSVFSSVDSAHGPLLEYDRQFLDALYNDGKTLNDSEWLPSCNDYDADNTAGGVDPTCSRYDAGENPYHWMSETIQLIEKPVYKLGLFKSLSESLVEITTLVSAPQDIASKENFENIRDQFFARHKGLFDFYVTAGAHSLRYMTTVNLKSLKNLIPGILTETVFKENVLRQQTLSALEYIFTMQAAPQSPMQALRNNAQQFETWTQSTPYYNNLSKEEQFKIIDQVRAQKLKTLEYVQTATFSKIRQRLLVNLSFDNQNSYYFSSAQTLDVESYIITLLQKVAMTAKQGELPRSFDERKAAITSFMTFHSAGLVEQAQLEAIATALQVEIKMAKTSLERDQLRYLLNQLK